MRRRSATGTGTGRQRQAIKVKEATGKEAKNISDKIRCDTATILPQPHCNLDMSCQAEADQLQCVNFQQRVGVTGALGLQKCS